MSRSRSPLASALAVTAFAVMSYGCQPGDQWRTMTVTATAYNSLPEQTHPDHATVGAWGDELEPGMRVIAVSRDLERHGLERGTEVRIEGLPGTWTVRDRMHERWTRRIDVYLGEDVEAAVEWGRRQVEIRWRPRGDADATDRGGSSASRSSSPLLLER